MIHEIGVEIGAALAEQGCPIKVVDGPESTTPTTGARERIVIEHDEDAGDTFTNVKSQHRNPKMRAIRNIGAKITIYAQAVNANAVHWEHRRRCEHILDLVYVALNLVLMTRQNGYRITKARFIQPADLKPSEQIAGAVYEITLTIERGVYEQTWKGEKQPEGTLSGIGSTTSVNLPGSATQPEIGCGG